MGYRGKLAERDRARSLRAAGWTMPDIAVELGVSKGSVSLWTRDVVVEMGPRRMRSPRSNRLRDARLAEIDEMNRVGVERIGELSEQAFLAAGAALYAGEGAKRDGRVVFANSDPAMITFFLTWLRHFFSPEEARLRIRLYLHQGLDIEAAMNHWSDLTSIPASQFTAPYRAIPDPSIRQNKHEFGCATVVYNCSRTHREVMGLCRALLSSGAQSGVAQSAERLTVNQNVGGSSPSPGAKGP